MKNREEPEPILREFVPLNLCTLSTQETNIKDHLEMCAWSLLGLVQLSSDWLAPFLCLEICSAEAFSVAVGKCSVSAAAQGSKKSNTSSFS